MSKKAHSMVGLLELTIATGSLFVKISICDALSSHLFNDISKCITQVIRTIKTFVKYKSATADKFVTKKHK